MLTWGRVMYRKFEKKIEEKLESAKYQFSFLSRENLSINRSVPESLICVGSRLRQIGAFRLLRRDCTGLRHRRMSWTVSKGRASFQNHWREFHKFHDFVGFESGSR